MPLVLTPLPGESWRDCVERYASRHGLEIECLEMFDADVSIGRSEREAAFDALYDWDCLDYEEGGD